VLNDGGGNEIAKSEKKLNLRYAHQPTPAVTKQLLILAIEASIALFHRHAGERESGRNVRRRQWACLNFNQGDLVRDWSKPREVLLDEFDFPPVSFVFHFLTPCPPRRDLTLRASVTVERGRSHLKVTVRRARAVAPVKAVARQATK